MRAIRMDGDCVCGCMNEPDFASPPDGLPDRIAIARDDLRRESARTEMNYPTRFLRSKCSVEGASVEVRNDDGWLTVEVVTEETIVGYAVTVNGKSLPEAIPTESALQRTTPPPCPDCYAVHDLRDPCAVLDATRPTGDKE